MIRAKWWGRSKIIALNVFGVIVALLYALEPVMPQLRALLPANLYGWVAVIVPVATIILRAYSVQPLRSKKTNDQEISP